MSKKWKTRTTSIKNYNFDVVVDGLSLKKPIELPYPKTNYSDTPTLGSLYPIEIDSTVYGRKLHLVGYIYLQDGIAIYPQELRGLLIRIRNVAIGKYDPTFLDFPKIEGPRYSWLSGEVYVEDGLENALNIDRDSFNQTHAHYVALQQAIHNIIPTAFSEASRRSRERSQLKQAAKVVTTQRVVERLVSHELTTGYKIVESRGTKLPVEINTDEQEILVNPRSPLAPKSKPNRELGQKIGIIFELAMQAPESDRKQKFYELLSQLLDADK